MAARTYGESCVCAYGAYGARMAACARMAALIDNTRRELRVQVLIRPLGHLPIIDGTEDSGTGFIKSNMYIHVINYHICECSRLEIISN